MSSSCPCRSRGATSRGRPCSSYADAEIESLRSDLDTERELRTEAEAEARRLAAPGGVLGRRDLLPDPRRADRDVERRRRAAVRLRRRRGAGQPVTPDRPGARGRRALGGALERVRRASGWPGARPSPWAAATAGSTWRSPPRRSSTPPARSPASRAWRATSPSASASRPGCDTSPTTTPSRGWPTGAASRSGWRSTWPPRPRGRGGAHPRPRRLQADQRPARPPCGRRGAEGRGPAWPRGRWARRARAGAPGRRRVRGAAARRRRGKGGGRRLLAAGGRARAVPGGGRAARAPDAPAWAWRW